MVYSIQQQGFFWSSFIWNTRIPCSSVSLSSALLNGVPYWCLAKFSCMIVLLLDWTRFISVVFLSFPTNIDWYYSAAPTMVGCRLATWMPAVLPSVCELFTLVIRFGWEFSFVARLILFSPKRLEGSYGGLSLELTSEPRRILITFLG